MIPVDSMHVFDSTGNRSSDGSATNPDSNSTRIHGRSAGRVVLALTLFLMILLAYMLIEPYWVQKKYYLIESDEIPQVFDGTKIVFLTDIHHGKFYSKARVRKVVEDVNRMNADVVLLGGDYVEGSPKYIQSCFDELKKLRAVYGVYGVLGNHDHWQGADSCRHAMAAAGIKSIDNGAYWITKKGIRIRIGGVGDHCEDKQYPERTIDSVNVSDFVLLVSHSPDYAMEITTDKVDYMFSGHTHGGQITLFGKYAPKVPSRYRQKLRTGLVSVKNCKVIISNGIGTAFIPLRFFARPQIVIGELRRI
ncbi:MAG: metallophosphoesterase [Chitinispirillaceae bacterium]|nr:metallophosphoesterase [Chitinispirillaceae bacterium]